MTKPRNIVASRSPNEFIQQANFKDQRCKHTITLDGVQYQCMRLSRHFGIHDGFCKHNADGGLVRW
jgi:hypothetical protein